MSSTSHEQTRHKKKESKNSRANRVLAYGATIIALSGVAGIYKVHEVNKDARAVAEFNVANQEHNVVTFGANSTPAEIAYAAVEKGYLDMQPNEARKFIIEQFQQQLRGRGELGPKEDVDLGAIQPGTTMEVPGTWVGIGEPEPKVEIGTALTAESDGKGTVTIKETDQSGHTTTTVEQAG